MMTVLTNAQFGRGKPWPALSFCVFHVQMRDKERKEKYVVMFWRKTVLTLETDIFSAATALVQQCFSEKTTSNKVAQEKH